MKRYKLNLKGVNIMAENMTQAEFKVAYASIVKRWRPDTMGKIPNLAEFNLAASLGHAHQSNNTVVGAMGLRKNGFTRAQMIAYCPPCMNSRTADIEAGLIKPVTLPKVNGKTVYHQVFVKPKVKVAATKVAAPKPKPKVKPKGAKRSRKRKVKADKYLCLLAFFIVTFEIPAATLLQQFS